MRDAPGRTIPVRWTHALDEQVHGRAGRDELLLNRALLPSLLGASDAQARHDALATVLHELAHYHDRGAHGGISRDPRFLDLAGWQVRATRFTTQLAGRARENRFVDRSPDPYELTRPTEFFAVNVEHFLLDADYACRRPALHRYFSQRLGAPPGQGGVDCARDMPYLDAGEGEGGALGTIDPARVYAIDYLLAEGNAQPMSRWGHSMLRLVVCAPGREPGPDCRFDLAYHRVLSFRAFVDDVQISSWSGLTGRYPSRLFVLPMAQVIDEYTKVELRGLRSIPLKLDRDEVASVLERAAQLHWSYDGRYYFLGNNCAAETWKLLHDGVPRLAGQGIGSITPTGLLRRLEKAGVADASVLDDDAQALRLGYRFASQRTWFQQMYEVAREQLELPHRDVEDWIGLSPQARRPWLERADLRASAALLVLEQAALRRGELRVREQLKKRYLRDDARGGPDDAVRRLLQESEALGRPARLIDSGGYGLPQAAEREALARDGLALRDRLRETRAQLDRAARSWMTPEQREWMDGIAANADLIGRRVRMLHAEQGGLRLP
ncbi:zinc-dependent peptidase [Lysobacter sp. LF1]|uniref:Zinc-dependent peptidase n=2 Tax=Lysobacter stagni TaxID=3045172 RepID=A0ABT6XH84_9GAMM|nr:zinc-dependent peptidase [Lysobacter sp. LF1]MDI9239515.1 zinc-dependent peptidase [Lysobacter sp. LF1]